MRFRTPVNTSKASTKHWKTSPPPVDKSFPLQYCRPYVSVQQARRPAPELFEPFPVHLRFDEDHHSPLRLVDKPKYPRADLLNGHGAQIRGGYQRRLTLFGLFSLLILGVASMHLIYFGNRSFQGIRSNTGTGGRNAFFSDKASFFSTRRRNLVQGKPRIAFMDRSADHDSSLYQAASGRKVALYPAEFSDVTQLYSLKSSDDSAIDGTMELKFFPTHETDENCVPMSPWQMESFPTCNGFHEMSIVPSLHDQSFRLLSSAGSWRDVWRLKAYVPSSSKKKVLDNIVIKTMKIDHTLQDRYFEFNRVDALAMERLTSSPYVVGIHGFCGVSVVTERGTGDLEHVVNHISNRKKVDLARKVAKSIAAVHEIDMLGSAVSVVHNDINLGNIFMGHKNPLLNDFNIAVLMMKDRRTGESCSFPGHFPNPQWKSPEEQVGPEGNSIGELNEKVDIYALGNILFRMATGKCPWRDRDEVIYRNSTRELHITSDQKEHIARLKVDQGRMPQVPKETLKSRDPYVNVLLKAMKWCYMAKPEERPTAREVAEFLEKSKEEVDESLIEFGRFPKSKK
ncbi:hypothetical protein ACHAWF_008891 [Thalassiosira exigua]